MPAAPEFPSRVSLVQEVTVSGLDAKVRQRTHDADAARRARDVM
jgi:hypothetical protein